MIWGPQGCKKAQSRLALERKKGQTGDSEEKREHRQFLKFIQGRLHPTYIRRYWTKMLSSPPANLNLCKTNN